MTDEIYIRSMQYDQPKGVSRLRVGVSLKPKGKQTIHTFNGSVLTDKEYIKSVLCSKYKTSNIKELVQWIEKPKTQKIKPEEYAQMEQERLFLSTLSETNSMHKD